MYVFVYPFPLSNTDFNYQYQYFLLSSRSFTSQICHSAGCLSQFSCHRPPHRLLNRGAAERWESDLLQDYKSHSHILYLIICGRPSRTEVPHWCQLCSCLVQGCVAMKQCGGPRSHIFLLSCSDRHDFLWLFTSRIGKRQPLFFLAHSSSFQCLSVSHSFSHSWPSVIVIQPINEPSKMFFMGNDNSKGAYTVATVVLLGWTTN